MKKNTPVADKETPLAELDWLLGQISTEWSAEEWRAYGELKKEFRAEAERLRLGQQLRRRISDLGLTQKTVALNLGIQPSELNRIIQGKSNYSINIHLRLLDTLGLRTIYEPLDTIKG